MALTDIVWAQATRSAEMARGSTSITDISALPSLCCAGKTLELARGNVGVLVDEVTPYRKVIELPGYAGPAGTPNLAY